MFLWTVRLPESAPTPGPDTPPRAAEPKADRGREEAPRPSRPRN
jgi:hypothetical protein